MNGLAADLARRAQLPQQSDDQIYAAGSFEPVVGPPAEGSVRSVFFYNADIELGTEAGLHLFEPRYRLMIQRALWVTERRRQIVFLPNFQRYIGSHGDVGALAHITSYRPIRDGRGGMPRAEVTLRFTDRVMVLFHWEEPQTDGLHECTFSVLPPLPPPSSLLERMLDCLQRSSDRRYSVSTKNGFLDIHAEPASTSSVLGTLSDGDVVTELESHAGWIRHDRGWSVTRLRNDRFLWLVPHAPLAEALPQGVRMVPTSNNARTQHVLLHAPSAAAAAAARSFLGQMEPDAAACTAEAILPPARALERVSDAIERVAEAVHRYGVTRAELPGGEAAAAELAAQAGLVATMSARELQEASRLLHVDHPRGIERAELQALVTAAVWEAAGRVTDAMAARELLAGAHIPVACGAPCGFVIAECCFTQNGEPPLGAATPAGAGLPLPIPLRRALPGQMRRYASEQYAWEAANLPLCPAEMEALPTQPVACAAHLALRSSRDPAATVLLPARLAATSRAATDARISQLLRRVNWPRLRLLYLGQRQEGCPLSKLDIDLIDHVGQNLMLYTPPA
jgi:hypothetical protein